MSAPAKPPKDCVGNELHVGDVVTLHTDRPIIFRVMALEEGGIMTPKGMTPGRLALGVTLTLNFVPGAPLLQVIKVVAPGSDALVEKMIQEN